MNEIDHEELPMPHDMMTETKPEQLAFLRMRIQREQRHFAGAEMPPRLLLAWHAFLFGNLVGQGISIADYNELEAMLPPLPDAEPNPVQEIAEGREFDDDESA